MKIGSSSVRITPPAGVVLEGYASRKGTAEGIHDDLFVSCITIDSNGDVFSFLSFDLIGISNDLALSFKKIVSDILKIPRSHILLSATHTHSGPAILGLQKGNELNDMWLEILPKYVETCVKQSVNEIKDCYIKVGSMEERYVGKNRRRSDGITDPTLTVLGFFEKETDDLNSIMINYACHATILDNTNLMISSDYIHWIRKTVNAYNPNAIVLFLNGAEGDVNIGYSAERSLLGEPVKVERNFKTAEKMGKILGFDSLSIIEKGMRIEDGKIVSIMKNVKIPLRKGRNTNELRKIIATCEDELERFFLEQEMKVVETFPDEYELPLQLILFPKITLFCLPVEPFAKIGLELRSISPTENSMIVGLANGWYGYLPTPDEFEFGGYETRLGPWSYLDENASNVILKTFEIMLEDLKMRGDHVE